MVRCNRDNRRGLVVVVDVVVGGDVENRIAFDVCREEEVGGTGASPPPPEFSGGVAAVSSLLWDVKKRPRNQPGVLAGVLLLLLLLRAGVCGLMADTVESFLL